MIGLQFLSTTTNSRSTKATRNCSLCLFWWPGYTMSTTRSSVCEFSSIWFFVGCNETRWSSIVKRNTLTHSRIAVPIYFWIDLLYLTSYCSTLSHWLAGAPHLSIMASTKKQYKNVDSITPAKYLGKLYVDRYIYLYMTHVFFLPDSNQYISFVVTRFTQACFTLYLISLQFLLLAGTMECHWISFWSKKWSKSFRAKPPRKGK